MSDHDSVRIELLKLWLKRIYSLIADSECASGVQKSLNLTLNWTFFQRFNCGQSTVPLNRFSEIGRMIQLPKHDCTNRFLEHNFFYRQPSPTQNCHIQRAAIPVENRWRLSFYRQMESSRGATSLPSEIEVSSRATPDTNSTRSVRCFSKWD